jgi:immune inhibitor A
VVLPQKPVTAHIADPYAGSYFYFSGSANDLNNRMVKAFTLGAGATLAAKVNYGIEEGYDYANVIVSTDGGATWQTVPTNLSNSTVEANGIEGFSGGWVDLTASLPAGNVMVGFSYRSDGGVNFDGFMVDNIQITGQPLDGAEADAGWTFTGFRATTGTEDKLYSQYYVAEYRTYKGYDYSLKAGPYYFGYANTMPDYVDHFAYQDGMLVNYWDTSQADNNTGLHPGQGLLLTVDAHPTALKRCGTATNWRNRIQAYDSTFTLSRTDGIPNIHHSSVLCPVPSLPGVSVFDDRNSYYDPANPLGSVITPNTGTQIRIQSIGAQDSFMQIEVRPVK